MKTWVKNENVEVLNILKNAKYDEVDLHFYDDPEYWGLYLSVMKTVIPPSKKTIISEFGGPNKYISNSYKLEDAISAVNNLKVEEAYFFKLVGLGDGTAHERSGLISYPALKIKGDYFLIKDHNNGL